MRIEIVDDAASLGERAAHLVRTAIESGDVGVLGVATGSSPLPVYRALTANPPRGIEAVELFGLDEYVGLPAGDPRSYRAFLEREIVGPLGLQPSRLHTLDGVAADLDAECRRYEDAIAAAGGVDLQILGIGGNGHIAFNEPGSSPGSRTRTAPLAERTREDNARFFESAAEVPRSCLTQGIGTILEARRILLVAMGRGKAEALARAVTGGLDTEVPASFLQRHPDVTVVADTSAASLIRTQGVTP